MFRKKTLGIKGKTRSIDDINRDYNHHASNAGHKYRVIQNIQREIDEHIGHMQAIDEEARRLPKEPVNPVGDALAAAHTATEKAE